MHPDSFHFNSITEPHTQSFETLHSLSREHSMESQPLTNDQTQPALETGSRTTESHSMTELSTPAHTVWTSTPARRGQDLEYQAWLDEFFPQHNTLNSYLGDASRDPAVGPVAVEKRIKQENSIDNTPLAFLHNHHDTGNGIHVNPAAPSQLEGGLRAGSANLGNPRPSHQASSNSQIHPQATAVDWTVKQENLAPNAAPSTVEGTSTPESRVKDLNSSDGQKVNPPSTVKLFGVDIGPSKKPNCQPEKMDC
ncbi:hypothetical protein CROQUDRAFT_394955 [Cronartium quercuum f. sp. fusiforme G11]|uniref:Uncharacterized protein n=1 Tax=Cronartium quercuum f. sp. fusiforme G11 TaxID=708437 RepID=A0A9P6T5L5_9BASI|nr:hypothetical protein CROQUDRAFT_394955 [Cronartium quercuum f. sp. fusiforme G11]